MYRRARNWSASAIARPVAPRLTAITGPYRTARKSDTASPWAVVITLMIQKRTVICGTLLPRAAGHPARRLDRPAPVPPSAGRPQPVRRDRRHNAHLHHARLAVRPADGPLPGHGRHAPPSQPPGRYGGKLGRLSSRTG